MEKILFIVNPIAGGGKTKSIMPDIEQAMVSNDISYDIIVTSEPGEATSISKANAAKYSIVAAIGGDGTVNEVARGLISAGTGVLGIVPGGTGNDMAKSLGISLNPQEALQTLLNRNIKKMDIGTVNNRYFLNIASVGFDADVVRNVMSIKKKVKGKAAYILGVLFTLISFKKKNMTLLIDGESYKRNLVLLAVGNGGFYGGGMNILPMADITDGVFNVCSIRNISNIKMLFLFPSIFKGKHLKFTKYIEIFNSRNIIIKDPGPVTINLDGELMENDREDIEFCFEDFKLKVISG